MVFIAHNSLKSDRFFNPIFIPCFSGFMLFRVRVIQDPGPGFRSSHKILPDFDKKVYKRVHIKDILLNTVSSATRATAHLGTRSATRKKFKRSIY